MIYNTPIYTGQEITPELFNHISDNCVNTDDNIHKMYDVTYQSYFWAEMTPSTIKTNKIHVVGSVTSIRHCNDFIPIPSYMIGTQLRLRFTVNRIGLFTQGKYRVSVGTSLTSLFYETQTIDVGSVEKTTGIFTPVEACCIDLGLSIVEGTSPGSSISITKVILERVI